MRSRCSSRRTAADHPQASVLGQARIRSRRARIHSKDVQDYESCEPVLAVPAPVSTKATVGLSPARGQFGARASDCERCMRIDCEHHISRKTLCLQRGPWQASSEAVAGLMLRTGQGRRRRCNGRLVDSKNVEETDGAPAGCGENIPGLSAGLPPKNGRRGVQAPRSWLSARKERKRRRLCRRGMPAGQATRARTVIASSGDAPETRYPAQGSRRARGCKAAVRTVRPPAHSPSIPPLSALRPLSGPRRARRRVAKTSSCTSASFSTLLRGVFLSSVLNTPSNPNASARATLSGELARHTVIRRLMQRDVCPQQLQLHLGGLPRARVAQRGRHEAIDEARRIDDLRRPLARVETWPPSSVSRFESVSCVGDASSSVMSGGASSGAAPPSVVTGSV